MRREEERKRETEEREEERQRKKKERDEEKEKKKKEKEKTEEKRKQARPKKGRPKKGRPKKGKQPVEAAIESPGSSSESECEVRSRLQRVRQLPARFWADSSSESESSDSGILCGLCSAIEHPNLNVCHHFLGGLWKLW